MITSSHSSTARLSECMSLSLFLVPVHGTCLSDTGHGPWPSGLDSSLGLWTGLHVGLWTGLHDSAIVGSLDGVAQLPGPTTLTWQRLDDTGVPNKFKVYPTSSKYVDDTRCTQQVQRLGVPNKFKVRFSWVSRETVITCTTAKMVLKKYLLVAFNMSLPMPI